MLEKIKINYVYILLILLFLLPLVIIGFYSFPDFDDFAYSTDTYHTLLNGGNIIDLLVAAFNTSMEFMQTWQGLYTSAFLLALQPGIFGEQFYFLTVILILAILFIGIYRLVRAIRKDIFKSTSKQNLLLSWFILFFVTETMPNPYEAFYWFNGAVNYLFFLGLLLIIVAEYITIYNQEKISIFRVIGLSILTFLLSGGNHITAFAGLFAEFLAVVMILVNKKKKALIWPFITGLLGFIFNITSPGTAVRAAAVNMDTSVIETLTMTFRKSFGFFSNFTSISLILFIIIILAFLLKDFKEWEIKFNKKLLLVPALSYILLCGMYCVPYYALGGYGGGRVTDTIYIIFVILVLINIGLLFKYLLDKKIVNITKIKPINNKIKMIVTIVIIVFIGYFGNSVYYNSTTREAIYELSSGEASSFAAQQKERIAKFKDDTLDEVIVKPLTVKPHLITGTDVCVISEANACDNNAINKYYNKKVIGTKEEA